MVSYDFFSNMKLFDREDRAAIEWGLRRVFDYDESKINQAIASQVLFNLMCCALNMHLLAETCLCSGGQRQHQSTTTATTAIHTTTTTAIPTTTTTTAQCRQHQ